MSDPADKPETDRADTARDERMFKLVEFLTTRLEHTLNHSQTSTKHIYLVNAAILAAAYFLFGRNNLPLWVACAVTAALALLLCLVNWLHANFLNVQNAWYRAIDEQIRAIFLKFENFEVIWPELRGETDTTDGSSGLITAGGYSSKSLPGTFFLPLRFSLRRACVPFRSTTPVTFPTPLACFPTSATSLPFKNLPIFCGFFFAPPPYPPGPVAGAL